MSESSDGPGQREVAHRAFAAEYEDATLSYRESDEERAPSYVVTPSGAKANRLFFVGVLTEVESVNEEMVRARVVDPTGAFVVYAGQYQPDERTFFERANPPEFVAVTGKARTFQPEDSDRVFSSVRPESVNAVDADTRDRWVVNAAERTLDRVAAMATALRDGAGEDPQAAGLDPDSGRALALDHYDTSPAYLAALRDLSLDAVRVVAGIRDEVRPLAVDPDDAGDADLAALAALGSDHATATPAGDEPAEATGESGGAGTALDEKPAEPTTGTDGEPATGIGADAAESVTASDGSAADAGTEDADTADAGTDDADADVGTDVADAAETDDVGDFEPGGIEATPDEEGADGTGTPDAEPATDEMYELDDDERREIEQEYGTEFATGTEVDDPGEADIETPDGSGATTAPEDGEETTGADDGGEAASPDDAEETATADDTGGTAATDDAGETEADEETAGGEPDETGASGDDEADDVDLDEAVMDHMHDLDEGTGADREALVEAVADATGADRDAIEDAIQDALMGGQCYEPDDETLKPI